MTEKPSNSLYLSIQVLVDTLVSTFGASALTSSIIGVTGVVFRGADLGAVAVTLRVRLLRGVVVLFAVDAVGISVKFVCTLLI